MSETLREIERYYREWANAAAACRCAIISSVRDKRELKMLRDIESQCMNAGWEPFSVFRAHPLVGNETVIAQRAIGDCLKRLKNNADVCVFWNGPEVDVDSALLTGYLMSAQVPVIVMGERVSPIWNVEILCYCKSTADLQLFIDNYLRYEMPTVQQRLRRAAGVLR